MSPKIMRIFAFMLLSSFLLPFASYAQETEVFENDTFSVEYPAGWAIREETTEGNLVLDISPDSTMIEDDFYQPEDIILTISFGGFLSLQIGENFPQDNRIALGYFMAVSLLVDAFSSGGETETITQYSDLFEVTIAGNEATGIEINSSVYRQILAVNINGSLALFTLQTPPSEKETYAPIFEQVVASFELK